MFECTNTIPLLMMVVAVVLLLFAFATAKNIIGDNTKRQGFDLTLPNNNNGRIFLNEDDYQIA